VRGHLAVFTAPSYPAHITPLLAVDVRRVLGDARCSDNLVASARLP